MRKWKLRCQAVQTSFEEAGDDLFTFTAFPLAQWKALRTTNALERINEEFRRRTKTPERFDVARGPNDHLAFGEGIHFCLGAPLARLEARIAFEAIVERFATIALVDPPQPLSYRESFVTRGLRELPLIVA